MEVAMNHFFCTSERNGFAKKTKCRQDLVPFIRCWLDIEKSGGRWTL